MPSYLKLPTYVLEILGFLVNSILVYICLKNIRKSSLTPIRIYILISYLNIFLSIPIHLFFKERKTEYDRLLVNFFCYFELSIFYWFFYRILYKRYQKVALLAIFTCFTGYYIFILSAPTYIFVYNSNLYGIESLIITVPCFLYFYEIINTDSDVNFKKDPNFLVVTGAFVYFSITAQYFLLNFFNKIIPDYMFILNFINLLFYYLMFVMFALAFVYNRNIYVSQNLATNKSVKKVNGPSARL